jgi:hypothetical protein
MTLSAVVRVLKIRLTPYPKSKITAIHTIFLGLKTLQSSLGAPQPLRGKHRKRTSFGKIAGDMYRVNRAKRAAIIISMSDFDVIRRLCRRIIKQVCSLLREVD